MVETGTGEDSSYSLLVSPKVRLSFQEALLIRERNSVADTMARSRAEGERGFKRYSKIDLDDIADS